MNTFRFSTRSRQTAMLGLTGLLLLLVAAFPEILAATAEAPVITIKPGFNRLYRDGCWMPVMIELYNPGPTREDVLTIKQFSLLGSSSRYGGNERGSTIHKSVHLPRNSRKRFFTYLFPLGTDQVDAAFQAGSAGQEVSEPAVGLPHNQPFIVGCGRFEKDIKHLFNAPGKRLVQAESITAARLPDARLGYDAVDLLFMNDFSAGTVSADQWKGIMDWVEAGGILIVGGGLASQEIKGSKLNRYLPCEIRGLTQISSFRPFPWMLLAGTQAQPSGGATPVADIGRLADGAEVLVKDAGRPVAVASRCGAGRIVFLAFDINDPPFIRLSDYTPLWKRVAGVGWSDDPVLANRKKRGLRVSRYRHRRLCSAHNFYEISRLLDRHLGLPEISLWFIVLFLTAYFLVAIPLDRLITRKLGHVFYSIYVFPLIILAFVLTGALIGQASTHADSRSSQYSIIYGHADSRHWPVRTYIRFFTSDHGETVFEPAGKEVFFRGFSNHDSFTFLDGHEKTISTILNRNEEATGMYDWDMDAIPIRTSWIKTPRRNINLEISVDKRYNLDNATLVIVNDIVPGPVGKDNKGPYGYLIQGHEYSGSRLRRRTTATEHKIGVNVTGSFSRGSGEDLSDTLTPFFYQPFQEHILRRSHPAGKRRFFLLGTLDTFTGPLRFREGSFESTGEATLIMEIEWSNPKPYERSLE